MLKNIYLFQFSDASTGTGHHDLNKTETFELNDKKHFVQRIK